MIVWFILFMILIGFATNYIINMFVQCNKCRELEAKKKLEEVALSQKIDCEPSQKNLENLF